MLFAIFSFLGWAWETVYIRIASGVWHDRGFMTLPFCPIYGSGLLASYFLLGTPQQPRGLLARVKGSYRTLVLYLLLAFLIPTLVEYAVGFFFDKAFGIRLWNYAGRPLNLHGYVCMPVSIVWAVAVTVFMRFAFLPLRRLIFHMPQKTAVTLAVLLFLVMIADAVFNFSAVK